MCPRSDNTKLFTDKINIIFYWYFDKEMLFYNTSLLQYILYSCFFPTYENSANDIHNCCLSKYSDIWLCKWTMIVCLLLQLLDTLLSSRGFRLFATKCLSALLGLGKIQYITSGYSCIK
jgi:hypothetical protein